MRVPGRRQLAGTAAAAVLLAGADTYVVVLALPAMMGDLGISIDQLQRATPIISGFLLGYVAVMPLIGKLSDSLGRRPLLYLCLGLFAAGSLVTASAHDLSSAVAGRALQGVGGGGLVPVTLALVADLWPAARRGTPLGAVGAAQEIGSVAGPLYGAVILTLSTWRTIFWLNLPLCALLALLLTLQRGALRWSSVDWIGIALCCLALGAGALAIAAPDALVNSVTVGTLFIPIAGLAWLTPLSIAAAAFAVTFIAWRTLRKASGPGSLLRRAWRADVAGAVLIAVVLSAIVVSFATVDPTREAIAVTAVWALPVALVAGVLFVLRERRAREPLVDLHAIRDRAAFGALLTNLAIGAALMTALLDVPILARATAFPNSQLDAALVLLRLLAAVPVGAAIGGRLCQRFGNRSVAFAGCAIAACGLSLMTRFTATTLTDPFGPSWLHPSDPVLVLCGLGFGLAIAPVNASMLAAVRASMHGVASSLVVLARVLGMLVGVSVLTAVGLHAFFTEVATFPAAATLCPKTPLSCAAYNTLVTNAIVDELRTVFLAAALCAAVAAMLALALLRDRRAVLEPAHA
ncbi:MAG: MFS transporter [Candidatus Dormibacteraeota bacterium]|nr:MFS transporter [Candidatus Dormibacteraeota bacterium]